MEGKHHIDDLFKDRLADYSVPAPMHIWEKMNNEKGGRSTGWIKYAIPVFILGIAVAIYFMYPSKDNSTSAASPSISLEEKVPRGALAQDIISSNAVSTDNESKNIIQEEANLNSSDFVNQNNSTLDSSTKKSQKTNVENEKEQNIQEPKTKKEHNLSATIDKQSRNTAQSTNQEKKVDSDHEVAMESERKLNQIELSTNNTIDITKQSELTSLPFLKNLLNAQTFESIALSPCHFIPTDECFDDQFDAKSYADFIFSADFVFKDLSSRFQQTEAHLSERLASEYFYYAYSSGVRLSRVSEQGIAMRTGLIYSQINEVFDHTSTEYIPKAINVTIDTMYNPNGDTIFVWDTISVIDVVEERTVTTNKYRLLDIPLTIGYEYPVGKFIFNVNGGIMLNLFMKTQGNILDLDGEVASINADDPNPIDAYKSKIGLSVMGSFGVNYRLSNNVIILFEPYIRHVLQPVSHPDYPLEQKLTMVGLRTGLRYKF